MMFDRKQTGINVRKNLRLVMGAKTDKEVESGANLIAAVVAGQAAVAAVVAMTAVPAIVAEIAAVEACTDIADGHALAVAALADDRKDASSGITTARITVTTVAAAVIVAVAQAAVENIPRRRKKHA